MFCRPFRIPLRRLARRFNSEECMLDSGILKRTCAAGARIGSALLAAGLIGCGGSMAFSDSSSLAIVGDPPAPPPPPVAKPEPPPKPKRVEVKADKIEITEKIQFDY